MKTWEGNVHDGKNKINHSPEINLRINRSENTHYNKNLSKYKES